MIHENNFHLIYRVSQKKFTKHKIQEYRRMFTHFTDPFIGLKTIYLHFDGHFQPEGIIVLSDIANSTTSSTIEFSSALTTLHQRKYTKKVLNKKYIINSLSYMVITLRKSSIRNISLILNLTCAKTDEEKRIARTLCNFLDPKYLMKLNQLVLWS